MKKFKSLFYGLICLSGIIGGNVFAANFPPATALNDLVTKSPLLDVRAYNSNLKTAIVNAKGKTIAVYKPITLSDNVIISNGVGLYVAPGGLINANNHTITFKGVLVASSSKIFSGFTTNAIKFNERSLPSGEVYPEWFGAIADGSTDCATALNLATNSIWSVSTYGDGGVIKLGRGRYNIATPWYIRRYINVHGTGMGSTIIYNSNVLSAHALRVETTHDDYARVARLLYLEDFQVAGNAHSGDGIYIKNATDIQISRVYVQGHGGRGINFDIPTGNPTAFNNLLFVDRSLIMDNRLGGIRTAHLADTVRIEGCMINYNGKYGIYCSRSNQVYIGKNEFAGYYYGAKIASECSHPIMLCGGNNVTLEHNSFENNSGTNTISCYNLTTGVDGDTMIESTYNVRQLWIKMNDFKGAVGGVGKEHDKITHIDMRWAKNVNIEGNYFENAIGSSDRVVGVKFGIMDSGARVKFVGNWWDTTIASKTTPVKTNFSYVWFDDVVYSPLINYDHHEGLGFVTDPGGSVDGQTFWIKRRGIDYDYPSYEINAMGAQRWGDSITATDTSWYRYGSGVLKTAGKALFGESIGYGDTIVGSVRGARTRKIKVYDGTGSALGYVQIYSSGL